MHPHPPTSLRLCRADGRDAAREAALAEIDTQIDALKACVRWLMASGAKVLDADLRRGRARPVVTLEAAPWLQTLFRGDCANTGYRVQAGLAIHTWKAVRYGVTITWEVTCPA